MDSRLVVALFASLAAVALLALFIRARGRADVTARAVQAAVDIGVLRAQVDGLVSAQASMQQALGVVHDVVRGLETRLVETGSGIKDDLARDLHDARRVLDALKSAQDGRRERDEALQQAIGRIEAVIAGQARRGEAGEQIIAAALRQFPAGMVEHGYRVNGKEVEFALVLPDGRRLPIDSKWTAAELLRRLAETPPGSDSDALADEIERNLQRRVREVTQYICPPHTLPWAVAAVPDPAYGVVRRAHLDAYRSGVVLLPYSQVVPYVLTLYQMHLQHAGSVDVERLNAALTQVERHLDGVERTLENSLARAITMLENAYGELRRSAGDVRGTLAGLRAQRADGEAAAAEGSRAGDVERRARGPGG
jgi:DNA recombination protein RmuC